MLGGVTRHMLPHQPGVPHLHVKQALRFFLTRERRVSFERSQGRTRKSPDGLLDDTKARRINWLRILKYACSKYFYLTLRIEICTNYCLLAFSSLLRSIVLKQIHITLIQKTCHNFLLWWFSRDFHISDNLAYQKCFVLQRLLYSGFIFTAILLYVYWMNRWVLVWIHFNVFKGDTQTKTLKRVFADHILSAFSSIHDFLKKINRK